MTDMEPLLTIHDIADRLKVSLRTAQSLVVVPGFPRPHDRPPRHPHAHALLRRVSGGRGGSARLMSRLDPDRLRSCACADADRSCVWV